MKIFRFNFALLLGASLCVSTMAAEQNAPVRSVLQLEAQTHTAPQEKINFFELAKNHQDASSASDYQPKPYAPTSNMGEHERSQYYLQQGNTAALDSARNQQLQEGLRDRYERGDISKKNYQREQLKLNQRQQQRMQPSSSGLNNLP